MAQESPKREDNTACEPPEGPVLCSNNCGFFGSRATMSLCSQCYRDMLNTQTKASSSKPNADKNAFESLIAASELSAHKLDTNAAVAPKERESSSGHSGPSTEEPPKQPLNRCFSCRKKVGLTGFKCRCGYTFCSLHRYSEKHDCSFDYKTVGREALSRANPVVKADKLDKI